MYKTPLEDIIAGCKKGNPKHQEELYKRFAGKMMAVCKRYVRTDFEAEDVFQDAFLKVFMSLNSFSNAVPFEAWLRRIVVNTAINHYHKTKKERFFNSTSDENLPEIAIDDDYIDVLSAEEISKMIQLLPDGYRLVFNLYVVEGYTHQEISEILNISPGTSKSQLFKAKQILKSKIVALNTLPHE